MRTQTKFGEKVLRRTFSSKRPRNRWGAGRHIYMYESRGRPRGAAGANRSTTIKSNQTRSKCETAQAGEPSMNISRAGAAFAACVCACPTAFGAPSFDFDFMPGGNAADGP